VDPCPTDRLLGVGRLGLDDHVGLRLQQEAKARAHERMVVDDEDADWLRQRLAPLCSAHAGSVRVARRRGIRAVASAGYVLLRSSAARR
jgi:hypothetical protein